MIHVQIKSKKSFQIHSHLNDENDEQLFFMCTIPRFQTNPNGPFNADTRDFPHQTSAAAGCAKLSSAASPAAQRARNTPSCWDSGAQTCTKLSRENHSKKK